MQYVAVFGSGFGDEGKGKVVSYLCSLNKKSLVVRFSGGQQAGHHVMLENGSEHVFSNFGSGGLQSIPTYWTKYCTFDPVGVLNELDILKTKVNPILYVDKKCPLTTTYEKAYNIEVNKLGRKHGSCGVGVGQTFQREEDHHSILFEDIHYPSILKIKLNLLAQYYSMHLAENHTDKFLSSCEKIRQSKNIICCDDIYKTIEILQPSTLIFEGSQGLMLDQNFGFFPHVTRSNTGSKNILEMGFKPEVWLVTRAYQTRHGNGPMTTEYIESKIEDNAYEKNDYNEFQGYFRKGILDLDLINYAISKDDYIKKSPINLVVTCLDLLQDFSFMYEGELFCEYSEEDFIHILKNNIHNVKNIFISKSPFPELTQIK